MPTFFTDTEEFHGFVRRVVVQSDEPVTTDETERSLIRWIEEEHGEEFFEWSPRDAERTRWEFVYERY